MQMNERALNTILTVAILMNAQPEKSKGMTYKQQWKVFFTSAG